MDEPASKSTDKALSSDCRPTDRGQRGAERFFHDLLEFSNSFNSLIRNELLYDE